jgi:hypothetical protein
MIIHAVDSDSRFVKGVNTFHRSMFHGLAVRKTAKIGTPSYMGMYELGDKLAHPLYLARNIFRIPDAFVANLSLIISEPYKTKLKDVRDLAFLETRFDDDLKVFEWKEGKPAPKGWDVHWEKQNDAGRPATTEERRKLGHYYELIVRDAWTREDRGKAMKATYNEGAQTWEKEDSLDLAIVRALPITYSLGFGYLFHEKAFELMKDAFDWRYFARTKLDV